MDKEISCELDNVDDMIKSRNTFNVMQTIEYPQIPSILLIKYDLLPLYGPFGVDINGDIIRAEKIMTILMDTLPDKIGKDGIGFQVSNLGLMDYLLSVGAARGMKYLYCISLWEGKYIIHGSTGEK